VAAKALTPWLCPHFADAGLGFGHRRIGIEVDLLDLATLDGEVGLSFLAHFDIDFRSIRASDPALFGAALQKLNRSAATGDRWATRRRSSIDDRPET
jgi:hypothetical protein